MLNSYDFSKNYKDTTDEWFFRPVNNTITDLSEIILSNYNFGIRVVFEKIDDTILGLRYKELIKDVKDFKTNEIFVSTNIVLSVEIINSVRNNLESYKNCSLECERLRKYLIDEFLTQKNNKQTDYEIGRYFENWKRITEKLIEEYKNSDTNAYENLRVLKIQQNELKRFQTSKSTNELVKDSILIPKNIKNTYDTSKVNFFFNEKIYNNESQMDAVKKALLSDYFHIIQGPPGTGKTTIIRELIQQQLLYKPSSRILVTSQTNIALDNVLRGLDVFISENDGITTNQIIRCGSPCQIADDILQHSFDVKYKQFKEKYNEEIQDNILANDIRKDLIQLMNQNLGFEDLIKEHFLKKFKVIGATCVGLEDYHFGLKNLKFDLVIIDEAGKILPGDLVIPINRAKKVVIIGDHKQLPPIVDSKLRKSSIDLKEILNEQDEKQFFEKSLFERIFEECPSESKTELKVQYRMPLVIAGLVNLFYENDLITGESCYQKQPLIFDNYLMFIDMKNEHRYKESSVLQENKTYKIENKFEPVVVKDIIEKVREKYLGRIVVIAAYKNQVNLIRKELGNLYKNVVVNTIDNFQGDEEEVVIYCMTHAKQNRNDFYIKENRLNVAFSRSKNTLFIIGSSSLLSSYGDNQKVKESFEYIEKNGKVITYEDFLNIK